LAIPGHPVKASLFIYLPNPCQVWQKDNDSLFSFSLIPLMVPVMMPRQIFLVLLFGLVGCVSLSATDEKVLVLNEVGLDMFAQGDFRGARESFEYALELSPHDPDLVFNLAQCHDRLGNFQRAEQYYIQCLQLAAGKSEARYALGMLYYKTTRPAEAVRLIEEWLVTQPRLADPYALDGWRLRQEKDHYQAQCRLEQALGMDQNNVHALTELAILYESMGMPDRSLVLYERALAANPRQRQPEIAQRLAQLRANNVRPPLPD
jgi:tetratricopeptide (TPR) repeat protein